MAASAEKDDIAAKIRAAYGRGRYDAEKRMNAARLMEAERHISAQARKVLECVPLQEAWTTEQINSEIGRRGMRMDKSAVLGCLGSLKDAGLVREPSQQQFVRVFVQPPLTVVKEEPKLAIAAFEEKASGSSDPALKGLTPLETFAFVAGALRALATDIENTALEVESLLAEANAKVEKFRQLQELLKGLA